MTTPAPEAWADAWERRIDIAYGVVPYVLLLASTLLAVTLGGNQSWAEILITLGLVGLVAIWMLWMLTLRPSWTRQRMAVYYVGLLIGIALLIGRSPWFSIFAITGYMYAFACAEVFPRRWSITGVALTAILVATAQRGGIPQGLPQLTVADIALYALLIALNGVVALAVTFVSAFTREQSQRRKEIIAELATANRKLTAALEDNAGLQAQLLDQAREAGVAEERQRMAREIHDTLAQGFTGIIAQLEVARLSRQYPEQWLPHVEQAQTLARESLREARRSMRALRPAALEHAQLPAALAELARRWSQSSAITPRVEITGEQRPLPPEVEVTLYRVAQEALTNVAKHATATRVGVTLSYLDDMVLLDIRDDGTGFDAAAVRANGHAGDGYGVGLGAMRQRLHQVGGTLEIETNPGEGTAINASVPIAPAVVEAGPCAGAGAGAGDGAGVGVGA